MPTQAADRLAQYLIITGQLLDRGSSLMGALERAKQPGPGKVDIVELIDVYELVSEAVMSAIKLDMGLREDRTFRLRPRMVARAVAIICHKLDAAASLLPDPPKPPRHAESATLRARVNSFIPVRVRREGNVLPFVRPAG